MNEEKCCGLASFAGVSKQLLDLSIKYNFEDDPDYHKLDNDLKRIERRYKDTISTLNIRNEVLREHIVKLENRSVFTTIKMRLGL